MSASCFQNRPRRFPFPAAHHPINLLSLSDCDFCKRFLRLYFSSSSAFAHGNRSEDSRPRPRKAIKNPPENLKKKFRPGTGIYLGQNRGYNSIQSACESQLELRQQSTVITQEDIRAGPGTHKQPRRPSAMCAWS